MHKIAIITNVIVTNIALYNDIPDGGILADGCNIGDNYANGVFTPPAPVVHIPTVDDFTTALTNHLDATAQQRRYDNRITCMVRAGFPGPFQAEAIAFATWADTCNALAYTLLEEVQDGTRQMPETTQALIDVMPAMVWPT